MKIKKEELIKKLGIKNGKDGANGLNGSPDTGIEIVNKINQLEPIPNQQIDAKHIKNLTTFISSGRGGGTSSSSGSGGAWGSITGTLSDQTDLQAALDAKVSSQWVTDGNDIYSGNSGNVGIGTGTTNATEKLQVVGNVLASVGTTLGAEVLSQTTFTPSHTNWDVEGYFSFVGDVPTFTGTGGAGEGYIFQLVADYATAVAPGWYQIEVTLANVANPDDGEASILDQNIELTNGLHTVNFFYDGTGDLPTEFGLYAAYEGADLFFEVVSVSLKPISGGKVTGDLIEGTLGIIDTVSTETLLASIEVVAPYIETNQLYAYRTDTAVAAITTLTQNNGRVFDYQDAAGDSILNANWDSVNFHHHLADGAGLIYNLHGGNVWFTGNDTGSPYVKIAGGAQLYLDAANANNGLVRVGTSSYATAGNQLTAIALFEMNTWAWNGSSGAAITTNTKFLQTQLSTTNGDARMDLNNNALSTVFSIFPLVKNIKIAGTALRATTEGTNHLDIFDGTAPAGTLANGISLYSTSGELRVMDAAGNATLLSPHEKGTNNWIYDSVDTTTGKHLRIDMERMLKFINNKFGTDFIKEFYEKIT